MSDTVVGSAVVGGADVSSPGVGAVSGSGVPGGRAARDVPERA
jgi:hypothetical protein